MFNTPVLLPSSTLVRPEKPVNQRKWLEKILRSLSGQAARLLVPVFYGKKQFLASIHAYYEDYSTLDEARLKAEVRALKTRLNQKGYTKTELARAFALVRVATGRTLGQRHYDVQLIGGMVLFYGNVAEMKTGEGKTLTASLPAAAAALRGIPVHIITVNDYLARRDADELRPAYAMLGLSVGCITNGLTPAERRIQYSRDIVYCTNNELVFDYLKDGLVIDDKHHALQLYAERIKAENNIDDRLLLRGLHFAIIDEADSVLMDEARTPLIISGEESITDQQEEMYRQAIKTAAELEEDKDFRLNTENRNFELTDEGKVKVYAELSILGGFWRSRLRTFELITLGLSALHRYELDKDYLIRDGKVMIIDEHTGRVLEGRSWERGLHQLIEIKEGCELTRSRKTLARISYQSFFRKYFHVCGMTGTASEVSGEFWSVYGLRVMKVPTHRPVQRRRRPVQITRTDDEKWQSVLQRIIELHNEQRAVLIGTMTVQASEILSGKLESAGLPHRLLNAKQDRDEAGIIAEAGQPGQITIATNMAGRGTDIELADQVRNTGGLYVILTELHDAGRIDRQLEGRCARQGDPGEFEMIISVQDHLLQEKSVKGAYQVVDRLLPGNVSLQMAYLVMKLAQKFVEMRHHRIRTQLLKFDEKQVELLSFSGRQS